MNNEYADGTASSDKLVYRVASGGIAHGDWVVVPIPTELAPNPPPLLVGLTREKADKECARLNGLANAWEPDDGRRDAVLQRMLTTPR